MELPPALRDLAEPSALLRCKTSYWVTILMLRIVVAMVGVAALGGAVAVEAQRLALAGVGAALLVAGGVLAAVALVEKGSCLAVYPDGFAQVRRGQAERIDWGDIESYPRFPLGTSNRDFLRTEAGKRLKYDSGSVEGLDDFARTAAAEVHLRRLPEIRAAIQDGETVDFVWFRLDDEGISWRRGGLLNWTRAPWEEVDRLDILRGNNVQPDAIRVISVGDKVLSAANLHLVPNARILFEESAARFERARVCAALDDGPSRPAGRFG